MLARATGAGRSRTGPAGQRDDPRSVGGASLANNPAPLRSVDSSADSSIGGGSPAGPPGRPKRRPGRPRGPYLIQTRAEIEAAYRDLWIKGGRRPYWIQVARALGVDERALRDARRHFGLDEDVIVR